MGNICTLRADGEENVIELRMMTLSDIYNPIDPSPLEEKSLKPDTIQYILQALDSAADWKRKSVSIHIFMSEPFYTNEQIKSGIESAIPAYFRERFGVEEYKYRVRTKQGRRYLLYGTLFLTSCIIISTFMTSIFRANDVVYAIGQSIVVIGWVALWKPAEFYLFDRRDMREYLELLKKAASACVVTEELKSEFNR
ncbi:MAG: hypothetical protein Q4Q04_02710 [Methanocorpusculum sp.]|nr:hypothetical protein [Methanocorpusculum sp.]